MYALPMLMCLLLAQPAKMPDRVPSQDEPPTPVLETRAVVGPVRLRLDDRPVWTFRSEITRDRRFDERRRAYLYTVPSYPVFYVPYPVYLYGGFYPVPYAALDLDLRLHGVP